MCRHKLPFVIGVSKMLDTEQANNSWIFKTITKIKHVTKRLLHTSNY